MKKQGVNDDKIFKKVYAGPPKYTNRVRSIWIHMDLLNALKIVLLQSCCVNWWWAKWNQILDSMAQSEAEVNHNCADRGYQPPSFKPNWIQVRKWTLWQDNGAMNSAWDGGKKHQNKWTIEVIKLYGTWYRQFVKNLKQRGNFQSGTPQAEQELGWQHRKKKFTGKSVKFQFKIYRKPELTQSISYANHGHKEWLSEWDTMSVNTIRHATLMLKYSPLNFCCLIYLPFIWCTTFPCFGGGFLTP